MSLPARDPRHGLPHAYDYYGCRCKRCQAAKREKARAFQARKRAGIVVERKPPVIESLCAELGISYRQLDYWCRQGFVPGAKSRGSGRPREFTEAQVERIRTLAAASDLQAMTLGEVADWLESSKPLRRSA